MILGRFLRGLIIGFGIGFFGFVVLFIFGAFFGALFHHG